MFSGIDTAILISKKFSNSINFEGINEEIGFSKISWIRNNDNIAEGINFLMLLYVDFA